MGNFDDFKIPSELVLFLSINKYNYLLKLIKSI